MQKSEVNLERSRTWTLCNDLKVGLKYRNKFEKEFGGSFSLHKAKKWIWNSPVEEVIESPKKKESHPTPAPQEPILKVRGHIPVPPLCDLC